MFGYIAMYRGKKLEIRAESSYAAELEAARLFKTKKVYMIDIYLCETGNGKKTVVTTIS